MFFRILRRAFYGMYIIGGGGVLFSCFPSLDLESSSFHTRLAAGRAVCGINPDNVLKCWGDNHFGGVGNAGKKTVHFPVSVPLIGVDLGSEDSSHKTGADETGLDKTDADKEKKNHVEVFPVSVGVSKGHSCALLQPEGHVQCWGSNRWGQIGPIGAKGASEQFTRVRPVALPLAGVQGLAVGRRATCVVTRENNVACWGDNKAGELGDKEFIPALGYYDQLVVVDGMFGDLILEDIVHVSTGQGALHTCALDESGRVYCWGSNRHGELGHRDHDIQPFASVIDLPLPARDIDTGDGFSCATLSDERVYCWGDTPLQGGQGGFIDGLDNVKSLAAGPRYVCALHFDGAATCVGNRSLMPHVIASASFSVPKDVSSFALGSGFACMMRPLAATKSLKKDWVFCGGEGSHGALGGMGKTFGSVEPTYFIPVQKGWWPSGLALYKEEQEQQQKRDKDSEEAANDASSELETSTSSASGADESKDAASPNTEPNRS